ncbi:MAG TPA: apolipoprotein N-acyltransferase, partial [Thermodesulfobacteriota bacterium]|nr:apolipoprotein N-acyltransferase [Thermodesulfobacteriota bacterium]
MTKITKFDLLLSVISGVLFPLSFSIPYAGILAWFLLIPFFMALEHKSPGNGFKLGLLTGTVANAVGSYWIIGTIYRFGGFPYPVSFLFHLILSAY